MSSEVPRKPIQSANDTSSSFEPLLDSDEAAALLKIHPKTLQRLARRMENRFVGTQAAAEYSGIPAGTLRAWRCQGVGPRFYKPRGRALYDIADLDEFIRSGIRVSSVRASKEERNVYLPTG